jgi:hypothetical protein
LGFISLSVMAKAYWEVLSSGSSIIAKGDSINGVSRCSNVEFTGIDSESPQDIFSEASYRAGSFSIEENLSISLIMGGE